MHAGVVPTRGIIQISLTQKSTPFSQSEMWKKNRVNILYLVKRARLDDFVYKA